MTLSGMKPFVTPRALETAELPALVDTYRTAAKNADMAGFDGVEVHGANGYLLDQFTRDSTNKRDDVYGGSVENRCRLPLEITDAVVDVWGADRVGYRISPFQPYNDISDSDPSHVCPDHGAGEAKSCLPAHGGNGRKRRNWRFSVRPKRALCETQDLWPNTLITNGGYDRAKADAVIGGGLADMVSFGTPYLDPDLAERLHSGAAYNEPGNVFTAAPKDIPITHF